MTESTFWPDSSFARAVKKALAQRFALSLSHLMLEVLPPPGDAHATYRHALEQACSAAFPAPVVLGLHAEMRDAALAQEVEVFEAARQRLVDWVPAGFAEGCLRVVPLASAAWPVGGAEVMRKRFADDVGLTTQLVAPDAAVAEQAMALVIQAFEQSGRLAPQWADELQELVSEVVLAVNRGDGQGRFAGGSVFDLFGAILLNPLSQRGLAQYMMTLVHESSHLRLFAYHLDDEVLLNDSQELYPSPLRRQGRPMEGIFHAMWVSARMAAFGHAVLTAAGRQGLPQALDVDVLRRLTEAARQAYAQGLETVEQHARFTRLGAKIHADAATAMDLTAGGV